MKSVKITLGIFVMLAFLSVNEAVAQWAPDGGNIHNTNPANVGIGNFPAAVLLHVGKVMTEPTIRVQNFGGTGGATYQMMDMVSGADWKFKATGLGGFKIRDNAFALDVMTIEANSAANVIYVNSAGNVGIGTTTPAEKLSLEGDYYMHDTYPFIFLDNSSATGNAGLTFRYEGAYRGWIYYDDSDDVLRLNAESGGGFRNDLIIKSDGRVCLGTTTAATGYKLSVNGKVTCTEVLVEAFANWPDYVFQEDYKLMSLPELEASIKENNHLPGLPSASEVEEQGFQLGDMQRKVLQKVEELTLYTIEQGKQIAELQNKVADLQKENQDLKNKKSSK